MKLLRALCKMFSRGKISTSITKGWPITEFPEEVILLIVDYLALHDKYLLSQTCRTMRRLMACDWEQELLDRTTPQKIEFLLGIAYSNPDRWVCAKCFRLHAVDIFDHPLDRRAPACVGRSRCGPMGRYYLEHHHIQLALKLSRLGVNQSHLDKLLASCTHILEEWTTVYTYTAQPKIIGGRFVLSEKMTIENTHSPISQRDLEQGFIMFCPHLALPRSYRPTLQSIVKDLCPSTILDTATTLALSVPGLEIQGHCNWCPTDFTILFAKSQ